MDIQQLIIAGLATFAVGGLGMVFLEPILSGEAKAEKRQRAFASGATNKKVIEETGNRRRQVADTLKELDDRQKAQNKLTLEQRFAQAGLAWTKKTFLLFSLGSALAFAFLFLVASGRPILMLGGLVVGGLGFPRWYLGFKAKKRQAAFIAEFPNAIDAIVRGIKSGLPLGDCMRLIASEAKEPVKSEFRTIVEGQSMGVSIADAITKIYDRIPTSEVNFFGIVIQIQAKTGGNLGDILQGLSKVIRDRKKLRDKVDAMSMEAKSSAMIIGALPILVGGLVYVGSPEYIKLLWTTKAGMFGLGGCVGLMGIGVMVMRSMINFDI